MSPKRAAMELTLASVIWAFGFIATRWALEGLGPFWIITIRNAVAFALSAVIVSSHSQHFIISWTDIRSGLLVGLFLSVSLCFQTIGLQYTSVANSAFITVLYVLFVPLYAAVLKIEVLRRAYLVCLGIAFVGTILICRAWDMQAWNRGDLYTLACAAAGGLQILWISRVGSTIRSPFVFNAAQAFGAAVLAFVGAISQEKLPQLLTMSTRVWLGMGILTIASTMFAFFLQARAQRVLPATTSSLLCLLESPFAALFAWSLMEERLSVIQWVGALLIMAAAVGAVLSEHRTRNRPVSSATSTAIPSN